MPMAHGGLVKLVEECGELAQVAAKRIAYPRDDWWHPDGGIPLKARLEDELADVLAACRFVVEWNALDHHRVAARAEEKLERFRRWAGEPARERPVGEAP